jgi:dihydroflavonol-4-reductase
MTKGTVLVTGGTGFLARFCIRAAVRDGWTVRTVVRKPEQVAALAQSLRDDPEVGDGVAIGLADLTRDEGWRQAVEGCAYVLHVASPVAAAGQRDEDMIPPARDGTLRILSLARDAGVKRVVVTSSSSTVCYGAQRLLPQYDETHWTDVANRRDTSPYVRSKTIAERAAWDWHAREGGALELATVLPGLVLGPIWSTDYSPSVDFVRGAFMGEVPGYPRLGFQVVDARDLADLHLRVMTAPEAAGQRFLGTGEFLWSRDVADMLRTRYPDRKNIPAKPIPDWMMWLAAIGQPMVRYVLFELGKERRCPSGKAERLLGWRSRPARDTVLDTAASLLPS